MSDNLVANTMSNAEREIKKLVATEFYAWIRTADGSIQAVEREVAIACPRICHEMESGLGSSKNNPITLPKRVKPTTLSLVIDYCRFHLGCHSKQAHKTFDENFFQTDAKSLLELLKLSNYLQVRQLRDSTKKAMAQKISNKSTEEICHMLNLTLDLSEAEKSNLRQCSNHETRVKLLKKLYSNRRESLVKNVEHLKDFVTGVKPSQDNDTREVDDLVLFINGDGDTKGVKTSKNKKNHKKRKEQKKTSSSGAATSTKASTSKKVIEKNDEDINASDSANPSGSSSDTVDLLSTRDESFNVNEDAFYDNLDPVKDAETTRIVEAFALSLNLYPAQIYGDPKADFSCYRWKYINDKYVDPFIYIRTCAGEILQVEYEVGWQSPYLCDSLECGFGYSWSHLVCLSPGVTKQAVDAIFGYLQFSRAPGRSSEECQLFIDELLKKDEHTLWMLLRAAYCLQINGLFEMIRSTLAQITNSVPDVEQDLSKSFEQCFKGEELESQKNPNADLRTRLSNKLLAKQKKKLDEVENVKKAEAEVEVQKREDRSIDDLLSFINGDDESKGIQTSKKKKKNRNKGKQKTKTSSSSAFASTKAPASKKVTENHEQDMNASDSANRSGSAGDTSKLLGTEDESFNIVGDTVDDDMDPARMKMIDREVAAFAKRLIWLNRQSQRRTRSSNR